MINTIWPIALITFKEGLRHRVVFGVLVFSILFMIFTLFISGLFMRDIQKIILDLSLSAVSATGLLIPFFVAVNILSKDLELRTTFTILCKPVSRSQYILGKYLGTSLISTLLVGILTLSTTLTLTAAQTIYPQTFFQSLRLDLVLIACAMSLFQILLLTGCTFLWCSITTSSFLATLLSIATYLIGQTSEDIYRFLTIEMADKAVSSLTLKTVQLALYIFPNLAVFDVKFQAAYGLSISLNEVIFPLIYAVSYTVVALLITILIFSRRDLA